MSEKITNLHSEIGKVISGYSDVLQKVTIAIFADGHVLMESVPGLAKTTMIAAYQAAIGNSKKARIQMTPDLKPTDILGNRIFNLKSGEFELVHGPLYGCNMLLVDEINRGTPKTQSALLEAMQERKLSLAGNEYPLSDFFLVLATMNPIEQEGTYPLPEAQLDRFCFKVTLPYVSRKDELAILQNTAVHGRNPQSLITPAVTTDEILAIRKEIQSSITVTPTALEYIVDIVRATRPGDPLFPKSLANKVAVGASPRAQIWLRRTAQVRAYIQGRDHVIPEDVKYLAADVLRHRIILTQEAALESDFNADKAVSAVLANVPVIEKKSK